LKGRAGIRIILKMHHAVAMNIGQVQRTVFAGSVLVALMNAAIAMPLSIA
jgi:hypothetical protein